MRTKFLVTLMLVISFIFLPINVCSSAVAKNRISTGIDNRDIALWKKTVAPYLKDELWIGLNIYDAAHHLMIPLHVAFLFEQMEWQKQFSNHFQRFVEAYEEGEMDEGRLNRLHYLYLASRFLVLAQKTGNEGLIPAKLPEIVYKEIEKIWCEEPAWQWARKPFEGGISERLDWKLNQKSVKRSYYRAIIDEERFTFAIAADLKIYWYEYKNKEITRRLNDILEMAYKVFDSRGYFTKEGGWLFQAGVMTDHPDYAYVGHKKVSEDLEPSPISDIAGDTSHSHRLPLFLISLLEAPQDKQRKLFYEKTKNALKKQFVKKVLVEPTEEFPAFRVKNFMDGRNGVYRYGYKTQGENNGYGPYEMSGILAVGWWVFLSGGEICSIYEYTAKQFPLPKKVIDTYVGPNTTRERHPLVTQPNYYTNGFAELNVRLMYKLCVYYGDDMFRAN